MSNNNRHTKDTSTADHIRRRQVLLKPDFTYKFSPLVQQLLLQRGLSCDADLNSALSSLQDPFQMLGMDIAVKRLIRALVERQSILIVGDFDADGATSTALLIKGLALLGFTNLAYLLPDRFIFGYGLSAAIVDDVASRGSLPQVIITVDNGISSVEGVARANALGIDVIVTDHHLPGEITPDAFAIVNPNQVGCEFPHKNLAGVGVAFHLLMALRKSFRDKALYQTLNIEEPNLANLLDLVALGTVADVVKLDAYNRIFVIQGLARMRAGLVCEGVKALLAVAKKSQSHLSAQDIGFVIGPRINAAGRLDDMRLGVELLLETDAALALEFAQQLDGLNQDRKLIQKQMQLEAELIVSSLVETLSESPRIICVYHEQWHQGVVGLIASQLKEKFHCPVFAFAPVFDENQHIIEYKGSGRSIDGVHLRDLLDLVAKSTPECLQKFGGHAMAAGLSLKPKHYIQFKQAIEQVILKYDVEIFEQLIWVDGALAESDICIQQALVIENLLPWGQGLPEPLFQGEFYLRSIKVLAGQHAKCILTFSADGIAIDAIHFNADIDAWLMVQNSASKVVRVVYGLAVNRFRGEETVQLMIKTLF